MNKEKNSSRNQKGPQKNKVPEPSDFKIVSKKEKIKKPTAAPVAAKQKERKGGKKETKGEQTISLTVSELEALIDKRIKERIGESEKKLVTPVAPPAQLEPQDIQSPRVFDKHANAFRVHVAKTDVIPMEVIPGYDCSGPRSSVIGKVLTRDSLSENIRTDVPTSSRKANAHWLVKNRHHLWINGYGWLNWELDSGDPEKLFPLNRVFRGTYDSTEFSGPYVIEQDYLKVMALHLDPRSFKFLELLEEKTGNFEAERPFWPVEGGKLKVIPVKSQDALSLFCRPRQVAWQCWTYEDPRSQVIRGRMLSNLLAPLSEVCRVCFPDPHQFADRKLIGSDRLCHEETQRDQIVVLVPTATNLALNVKSLSGTFVSRTETTNVDSATPTEKVAIEWQPSDFCPAVQEVLDKRFAFQGYLEYRLPIRSYEVETTATVNTDQQFSQRENELSDRELVAAAESAAEEKPAEEQAAQQVQGNGEAPPQRADTAVGPIEQTEEKELHEVKDPSEPGA